MSQIQKLYVVSLMISLLLLGFGGFLSSLAESNNRPMTDITQLDAINSTLAEADKVRETLEGTDINTDDPLTLGFSVVRAAFTAVLLVPAQLGVLVGFITGLGGLLPIFPSYISSILTAFVSIVIILILIFAFLKVKP